MKLGVLFCGVVTGETVSEHGVAAMVGVGVVDGATGLEMAEAEVAGVSGGAGGVKDTRNDGTSRLRVKGTYSGGFSIR